MRTASSCVGLVDHRRGRLVRSCFWARRAECEHVYAGARQGRAEAETWPMVSASGRRKKCHVIVLPGCRDMEAGRTSNSGD